MTAGTGTGRTLRALRAGLGAAATVLPVAAYPVVFLYAHNAAELSFAALWRPLGLACTASLLIFGVLRALTGPGGAAVLLAQVALLVGAYYRLIENAVRGQWAYVRYWHLAPSLGLAFVLAAAAARGCSPGVRHAIATLGRRVAFIFAALLGLNLALAVPNIAALGRDGAGAPDRQHSDAVEPGTKRPNVYYIILDEYSGFDAIRRHYGYDNSGFLHFLKDRAFNVSLSSRNRTSATNIEVTNIMSMGAVVSGQTPEAERYARYRRGELLQFFKQLGYTTMVVNTVWQDYVSGDITYRGGSSWIGQTDGHGQSLLSLLLSQSILHPLELATGSSPAYIRNAFATLKDACQLPGPLFVFSHMRCPHEPFLFDAEGRTVSPSHHHDWRDKRHYLGFFLYATGRVQAVVSAILDCDPDAVILLQSDHGARARERLTGREVHPIPREDQLEILNAVYLRGQPLDIEGLDALETSLKVYAALFGSAAPGEAAYE